MYLMAQDKQWLVASGKWSEYWTRVNRAIRTSGVSKDSAMMGVLAEMREKDKLEVSATPGQKREHIEANADELPSVLKSTFKGKKKASWREIVEFIYENIFVEDVTPEDSPSAGAWTHLQFLRTHPALIVSFYDKTWSQLKPPKSELDANENMIDAEKDLGELIALLENNAAKLPDADYNSELPEDIYRVPEG